MESPLFLPTLRMGLEPGSWKAPFAALKCKLRAEESASVYMKNTNVCTPLSLSRVGKGWGEGGLNIVQRPYAVSAETAGSG